MKTGPSYVAVFGTIVRNSLVRDLSFRSNFLIESVSSVSWIIMNLGFYLLIFQYTDEIGKGSGWGKYEFFVFLATTMFINSIVQAFFMPNAQEFSELIRTGNLDFALLKPIDTQFLISTHRVEWSALSNFVVAALLLAFSLFRLTTRPENPLTLHPILGVVYPFYVVCGVAIMYSLMISLAATSIWLGRNQTLYNFWFYITNFSRYPMEIYGGQSGESSRLAAFGNGLRIVFTFVIPVLVVVNVPARLLALPTRITETTDWGLPGWVLPVFALVATVGSFAASRFVFQQALKSYRSASS